MGMIDLWGKTPSKPVMPFMLIGLNMRDHAMVPIPEPVGG